MPDYVSVAPAYGQNLVEFASRLAASHGKALRVIDVGANIGDSTMQIMGRVEASVLAVEADPYYLKYLRRNIGGDPRITVAEVLLTASGDGDTTWSPTRHGGTTHFVESTVRTEREAPVEAQASLAISDLRSTYPAFDRVDLIKSDTDGYDVRLIPELAQEYEASRPVLFFEYDPRLTVQVSGVPIEDLWAPLTALGYERVGFWGNAGESLAATSIDKAAEVAHTLLAPSHGQAYLDVVVVHSGDPQGLSALLALFAVPADGE